MSVRDRYMKIFPAESAMGKQVAGDHYKNLKIQPFEYMHANSIPFAEGCVIKYVTRWRSKGGIADLEKARHFLDMLIEAERADTKPDPVDGFDEARMDVIGQNGNDGEHYGRQPDVYHWIAKSGSDDERNLLQSMRAQIPIKAPSVSGKEFFVAERTGEHFILIEAVKC